MLSILKKHSLLYVEDEPEIQVNISTYLSDYFSNIYLADNGEKALELYANHRPDVLILDINLPKINGLDVAGKIRRKDTTIKIIMLTAYSEKEKLLRATELKLTKYLIKPVTPKAFNDVLNVLAKELLLNPSRFMVIKDSCIWDKNQQQCLINNDVINLSEKETRLLNLFVNNSGGVVSNEKIITTLWQDAIEREISIDSVKNQVSKLRKKLPNGCINNVYAEGYCFKTLY
jgi:two-component system response regulator VanR